VTGWALLLGKARSHSSQITIYIEHRRRSVPLPPYISTVRGCSWRRREDDAHWTRNRPAALRGKDITAAALLTATDLAQGGSRGVFDHNLRPSSIPTLPPHYSTITGVIPALNWLGLPGALVELSRQLRNQFEDSRELAHTGHCGTELPGFICFTQYILSGCDQFL